MEALLERLEDVEEDVRPRSRRYLDWIAETFGYPQPQQSGGLIIP